MRLKTDDRALFDYSLEQFASEGRELLYFTNDLNDSEFLKEHHGVQTHYEKLALEEGRKINYAVWRNKKPQG